MDDEDYTSEQLEAWRKNTTAIDEAVQIYARENVGHEGMVTGWVVMFASQRVGEDGEMLYRSAYSVGPDTNLFAAVGFADVELQRMRDHLLG